jgi:hypothetical protein
MITTTKTLILHLNKHFVTMESSTGHSGEAGESELGPGADSPVKPFA